MKTPSQEDLLGYVLGALDAQEQRDLQKLIDQTPEIEEQLLEIKAALLPLDSLETSGPRPGLARRTCEAVANWQNDAPPASLSNFDATALSTSIDSCVHAAHSSETTSATVRDAELRPAFRERLLHPSTWSLPDVMVGVALLAIMSGILFPTISYSRYNSRVAMCQGNLQQVGHALQQYSELNDGCFVAIPSDGNLAVSGCFGPILKDMGLLPDDALLACAGTSASLPPVRIPSCQQVINASCDDQLNYYRHSMAGHYGYTMGYRENDRYCTPRNMGRSNIVLISDRPSLDLPGRISANHNGSGQNCLFEDGHVEFVVGHIYGNDALFENDYGFVGPGSNPSDNVIAPSHLSPREVERLELRLPGK